MNLIGIMVNVLWMTIAGKILGVELSVFPAWADDSTSSSS